MCRAGLGWAGRATDNGTMKEIRAKLRARHQGFTLIELMITVAVIAILASVAYPSYIQHIVRTHRAAVQSFMHGVANKQEQYMLDVRSYAGGANALADLHQPAPADIASRYTVTVACTMPTAVGNCTAQAGVPTYTITATPIGAQAANDSKCGTLTLDQQGAKTPATSGCW
jgi:type IV pilus assembly protein PilE